MAGILLPGRFKQYWRVKLPNSPIVFSQIASVNGNRFRGSSDQEIDIWNECARLLTNAIIYFNSLILSKLLVHFRTIGDEKNLALVKKVSPVAWVNVNLNGTYSFSFERNVINMADILRPLTDETQKPEK